MATASGSIKKPASEKGGSASGFMKPLKPSKELAEIVGRPHNPTADHLLPDAVDHHPCRQRIFSRGNPLGQFASTTLFRLIADRRLRITG